MKMEGTFRSPDTTHEDDPGITMRAETLKERYIASGDQMGAARIDRILKSAHITGMDPQEVMRQIETLEKAFNEKSKEKQAA